MDQIIDIGKSLCKEVPLDQMLWMPGGGVTACPFTHNFKFIFTHILPALFIDQIFKLTGRKQL